MIQRSVVNVIKRSRLLFWTKAFSQGKNFSASVIRRERGGIASSRMRFAKVENSISGNNSVCLRSARTNSVTESITSRSFNRWYH